MMGAMNKRLSWVFLLLLPACSSLHAQTVTAGTPNAGLVRSKIKHVFVIYQENHTFDNYFGSYPGAENLSTALARAHGFRQYDPIGKQWVTPYPITDPDTSGPSQSRDVIEPKMHGGAMDRFVAVQERKSGAEYGPADAQSVGLITMSYYDCDTLPFLWKYAKTFTLFDRYFQAMAGPSTPNNVEVIAAQEGQSQGARFSGDVPKGVKAPGTPIFGDLDPAYPPYESGGKSKKTQIDQQYATLMLTLGGASDAAARKDTQGVRDDLATITRSGKPAIPWAWYQEGYNGTPTGDPGYEAHHNAPQYFGYLRNNDVFWKNEHPLKLVLQQLRSGTLPASGIFYIKGGSKNSFGWKPRDPDPVVQQNTLGDDDHPGVGDTDHEVGEAFVATFVNAIARSKYWKDSAIIVTWDDAGGYYDHVPPPQFEHCPDGHACGDGPRVPMMILSPYAKSGAVVHDAGDTASIVKFADTIFGTPALASLPDEHPYLPQGPRDASRRITDLLGAFDAQRLSGARAPIPASAAEIPDAVVNRIPVTMNCASLGIVPVRIPGADHPPAGYRARTRQFVP
jgi:phospholipase C